MDWSCRLPERRETLSRPNPMESNLWHVCYSRLVIIVHGCLINGWYNIFFWLHYLTHGVTILVILEYLFPWSTPTRLKRVGSMLRRIFEEDAMADSYSVGSMLWRIFVEDAMDNQMVTHCPWVWIDVALAKFMLHCFMVFVLNINLSSFHFNFFC